MHCLTLKELPPPPPDTTGWPWTAESPRLPYTMADGFSWPKICVVTPSLNQVEFIEETIRSVLLQGYPDIEYLIIDGGSTDGSVDIIKKYQDHLAYWVCEPDRGQAHAINKGLEKCSGDIFAWLNSDDVYLPGALASVGQISRDAGGEAIIAGDVVEFDDVTGEEYPVRQHDITLQHMVEFWLRGRHAWHQPGLFFPMEQVIRSGNLDESLHYLMDYDLLCRLLQVCPVEYVHNTLTRFRLHARSKTRNRQPQFRLEMSRISHRYWHLVPDLSMASAYNHITRLLVTTASYQLRRMDFRTSADLLVKSWRINPLKTLSAALRELLRLATGGRFTGQKV